MILLSLGVKVPIFPFNGIPDMLMLYVLISDPLFRNSHLISVPKQAGFGANPDR